MLLPDEPLLPLDPLQLGAFPEALHEVGVEHLERCLLPVPSGVEDHGRLPVPE